MSLRYGYRRNDGYAYAYTEYIFAPASASAYTYTRTYAHVYAVYGAGDLNDTYSRGYGCLMECI